MKQNIYHSVNIQSIDLQPILRGSPNNFNNYDVARISMFAMQCVVIIMIQILSNHSLVHDRR